MLLSYVVIKLTSNNFFKAVVSLKAWEENDC